MTLATDLNAWSTVDRWVIAPHCRGGAAQQGGYPFLRLATTSQGAGAVGGNSLLLDGSVNWKKIGSMTNYWAAPGGGYWNAW